jgi:hypothetical protein
MLATRREQAPRLPGYIAVPAPSNGSWSDPVGRRDPEPPGRWIQRGREVLSSTTRALQNADGRACSPDPAHHAAADGELRCRPRRPGRAGGSISGRRSAAPPTAPRAPDPAPRWGHAIPPSKRGLHIVERHAVARQRMVSPHRTCVRHPVTPTVTANVTPRVTQKCYLLSPRAAPARTPARHRPSHPGR